MALSPTKKSKKITLRQAAIQTKYSTGYLSSLCRSGKVVGEYSHNEWLVDEGSLATFIQKQSERKIERARELAETRTKERRAYHTKPQLSPYPVHTISPDVSSAEMTVSGLVNHSLGSQLFALSVASLILLAGSAVAHTNVLPNAAQHVADLAAETASGFIETYGDVPAQIAARFDISRTAVEESRAHVARASALSAEGLVPFTLPQPDITYRVSDTELPNSNSRAPSFSLESQNTPLNLAAPASQAIALVLSPGDLYRAIGAQGYAAIRTALDADVAAINSAGANALALGSATRDALAAYPHFVQDANNSFTAAVAQAAHAAIGTDVTLSYTLAAAGPASAHAVVAFVGGAGDALARGAAATPALATNAFLQVTAAPASLAPVLASGVFNVEYALASRFIVGTHHITDGYLAFVEHTGEASYAAAHTLAAIPHALEDTYLGTLGRGALRFNQLTESTPQLAAALSASERIALSTYDAINAVFARAGGALAFLLGSPKQIAQVPSSVASSTGNAGLGITNNELRITPESQNPNSQFAVRTSPAIVYQTTVGITQADMDASLILLRNGILATVAGMVQPVAQQAATNITTIQQVNMIQRLADLVVTNGQFNGGIFDRGSVTNASSVAATSGAFGSLTAGGTTITGSASLATTSVSTLAVGTTTSAWDNTLFAVGTSSPLLYVDSTTGRIGLGTTNPGKIVEITGDILVNTLTIGMGAGDGGGTNSAIGLNALAANATGYRNTAIGQSALKANIGGIQNTAVGRALEQNTEGSNNTAIGRIASYGNILGSSNVAVGAQALQTNPYGNSNTAIGFQALISASSSQNIALGYQAGNSITTGNYNVVIGSNSGSSIATLSNNMLFSDGAGNERFRVDSSGNLGIGTTSPWAQLSVNPSGILGPAFVVGSSTATNFVVANSGYVGVGTAAPGFTLDVNGTVHASSTIIGDFVSEKTFTVNFPSGTSNQKVQLYWPTGARPQGGYEVTVAAGFDWQNASGMIRKDFGVQAQESGTLFVQQTSVPLVLGNTSSYFTISDFLWDAVNLRWYLIISDLATGVQSGNLITVHVKSYSYPRANDTGYKTRAAAMLVSDVYSSDTTVYPTLQNNFMGKLGIGTTSPDALLALQQITNGVPFISAYRVTDAAPSGDFINYKTKAGTTLFRVDNSGNLLAGGIINTGSQTITSTSQPQFRVQYDASNEITTSVNATGTTTLGINGTAPGLVFTPQSNLVNQFNFTDASSNSVLSIDTTNRRVGIGTTSPYSLLSISNNAATAVNTPLLTIASTTAGTATSTLLTVLANGNVGIGTASPIRVLSIEGTGAAATGSNSLIAQFRNNLTTIGSAVEYVAAVSRQNSDTGALYLGNDNDGSAVIAANNSSLRFGHDRNGNFFDDLTIRAGGIGGLNAPANIGIGTTSPYAYLSVSAPSTNYNSTIFTVASSTPTATTTLFNIMANGNVGIGTASPATRLTNIASQIGRASGLTSGVQAFGWQTSIQGYAGAFENTGPDNSLANGLLVKINATNANDSIMDLESGGTRKVTFSAGGNVGIGTTNPGATLQVGANTLTVSATTTNVGIGTVNPNRTLEIDSNGGNSNATGLQLYNAAAGGNRWGITVAATGDPSSVSAGSFYLRDDSSGGAKFIVQTNGNVGIGTTNPGATLQVGSNVGNESTEYKTIIAGVSNNTTPKTLLELTRPRTDSVAYGGGAGFNLSYYNGSVADTKNTQLDITLRNSEAANLATIAPVMTLQSGGNVGIGTTSPITTLTVVSTGSDQGWFESSGNLADVVINNTQSGGRNWALVSSGGSAGVPSSFRIVDNTAGADRFDINASGNVGIGTTSPTYKLDINGTGTNELRLTDSGDFGFQARSGTTDLFSIRNSGTGAVYVNTQNSARLGFGVSTGSADNSTVEQMTINSSGNVGIGTTTPGAKLDVSVASGNGTGITPNIRLLNSAASTGDGTAIDFYAGAGNRNARIYNYATGVNAGQLRFATANGGSFADAMTLQQDGNVGIGTVSPATRLQVQESSGNLEAARFTTSDFVNGATGSALKILSGASTGNTYSEIQALSSGSTAWNNLVLQSGGGNVGIGTAGPATPLQVTKTGTQVGATTAYDVASFNDATPNKGVALGYDSSSQTGIVRAASNSAASNLAFWTYSGSAWGERVRIDNNGNVGIGTTTPRQKLEILAPTGSPASSGSVQNGILRLEGSTGGNGLDIGVLAGSPYGAWMQAGYKDDLSINYPLLLNPNGGNVGIGKTDPGSKLEIDTGTINTAQTILGLRLVSSQYNSGYPTYSDVDRAFINAYYGLNMGINYQRYLDIGMKGAPDGATGDSIIRFLTNPATGGSNATERMRIDGNGNVGIGTTSPATTLQIGNTTASQSDNTHTFSLGAGGWGAPTNDVSINAVVGEKIIQFTDGNTKLSSGFDGLDYWWKNLSNSAGDRGFAWYTKNSTGTFANRMRIDQNGNVGIGTTTPASILDIRQNNNGAAGATIRLNNQFLSANSNTELQFISGDQDSNATSKIVGVSKSTGAGGITGELAFYTKTSSATGLNLSERMRIGSTGLVGIGTTTPLSTLVVGGTGGASIGADYNIAAPTNGLIVEGAVGIGTASPAYTLVVSKILAGDVASFTNTGANPLPIYIYSSDSIAGIATGPSLSDRAIYFQGGLIKFSNGGDKMVINSSGNVGIGTTNPYSRLSVWGANTTAGTALFELTNSASTTLASMDNAGNFSIPVATATTTIGGGLNVNSGALTVDLNSGVTSAANFNFGAQSFDADAGMVTWVDLPVSSSPANGTIESYSALTAGNPQLTVYGEADGAGGVKNLRVGVGTTTPYARLSVWSATTTPETTFNVVSVASSTLFTVLNSGNVGIGNTNPTHTLDVTGTANITGTTTIQGLTVGLGAGSVANNTAVGVSALTSNTTGIQNTAIGYHALAANTTDWDNVAVGYNAAAAGTGTGFRYVVALGSGALAASPTAAGQSVAVGYYALNANTGGVGNTAVGYTALAANTTGRYNTALGNSTLTANVTGWSNTGIGTNVLQSNTGWYNTGVGTFSLYSSVSADGNAALGYSAGRYETGSNAFYVNNVDQVNTAGDKAYSLMYGTFSGTAGSVAGQGLTINGTTAITGTTTIQGLTVGLGPGSIGTNTVFGVGALAANTTGYSSVAVGASALAASIDASDNVAVGQEALLTMQHGGQNTGVGRGALKLANSTSDNTGIGSYALSALTSGSSNTAIGRIALSLNSTGSGNVALGYAAGRYETASNAFYVNNIDQVNTAGDKAYSLLYGTFSGTAGSLVGQKLVINGNVGIATTTPYSRLSVWGADALSTTRLFELTNSASTTLFSIANSGDLNIPVATATTTIGGGLNVNSGAFTVDSTTGVTTAANLALGATTFDTDAGVVQWVDMPITSASAALTVESYTASLNGNPQLTVYGLADGVGGVNNLGVGIGTTSPSATLAVQNNYGTRSAALFSIASSTSADGSSATTFMTVTNAGNVGIGTTSPEQLLTVSANEHSVATGIGIYGTYNNAASRNWVIGNSYGNAPYGSLTFNVGTTQQSSPSNTPSMLITSTGNVGIGSTTPWGLLSVNANGLANGAPQFVVGSSTATNFIVTNGGNVGIGTTDPGIYKLNVNGKLTATTGYFPGTGSANGVNIGTWQTFDNAGESYGSTNSFSWYHSSGARMALSTTGGLSLGSTYITTNPGSGNMIIQGNVGIGTTSPYSRLSVWGANTTSGVAMFELTNSASTTLMNVDNAGNVNIPVATATTTIGGGLNVNSNAFVVDSTTGATDIANLNLGLATFESDAGAVTWADMPVTSASAASTVERYTAMMDSNPALTISALSDGAGSITNLAVGVGTTTPNSTFAIQNTYGMISNSLFSIASSTSADGSSATTFMTVTNAGNVGIGTTTPGTLLSIGGSGTGINFIDGTTATSTISGNLYVRGTLRATVSYVGDLVFANGFRFTEATSTPPEALLVQNQFGSTAFSILDTGSVGIGTAAPAHTLDVAGDIGAIAFVNTSTRSAKTDINYVDASTTDQILDKLMGLKVATYRYKIESQNDPLRIGLIAEDTQTIAPEVLSVDGKGVDIYKLATFTLAGVQALAEKVDAHETRIASLEARMAALESGAVGSATSSPFAFSSSTLASAFEGFGVLIQKGIAQFNTLVFRQLVASKDADGTSSAGTVTILAGNTVAQVNNSLVLPSTKVFITFSNQVAGSWWVSDKTTGSFRVVLSAPQTGDVSFDYFLVQTQGQIATSTPVVQGSQTSTSSGSLTSTDTTPPVITLLGDNPVRLAVGAAFTDPSVTVDDGSPITTYVDGIEQADVNGAIDTSSVVTHIITYRAMDAAGNVATAQRSVIVGDSGGSSSSGSGSGSTATSTPSTDTTPPAVTLNGAAAMETPQGTAFTDPGATALDAVDGDLTNHIKVSGAVDTATPALYTLTYSATDKAGNTGSASRVVTVVASSTAATQ